MPPKKTDKICDNGEDKSDIKSVNKSRRGRPPIQKAPIVKTKKQVSINNEEELVLHLI